MKHYNTSLTKKKRDGPLALMEWWRGCCGNPNVPAAQDALLHYACTCGSHLHQDNLHALYTILLNIYICISTRNHKKVIILSYSYSYRDLKFIEFRHFQFVFSRRNKKTSLSHGHTWQDVPGPCASAGEKVWKRRCAWLTNASLIVPDGQITASIWGTL